ncbi:MAG: Flp family type IVb pilin [Syntrophomonadaceae bacterium]|nr:Flp family type IVb pilin [Syntrophomonadaceae bacterium]
MLEVAKRLVINEEGQGMAEYGLILAGIAVVVMVAITALGGRLTGLFDKILP